MLLVSIAQWIKVLVSEFGGMANVSSIPGLVSTVETGRAIMESKKEQDKVFLEMDQQTLKECWGAMHLIFFFAKLIH